MLVTFTTNSYADITMFGDVAVSLLKMMGQSGTVPGALMAEDVPEALAALQTQLAKAASEEAGQAEGSSAGDSADEEDQPVALQTRAAPLIELLAAAVASGDNVVWDK